MSPQNETSEPEVPGDGDRRDVFGAALRGWASGDHATDIVIERDDGHVDRHSPSLYFAAEPLPFERPALDGLTGPVLDVGCGAGRHLLWLAGQGIPAVGVDASPGAVEVCRRRGCSEVRCADVLTDPLPRRDGGFAAITLFGNNIGIGGTPKGVVAMLERLRGCLAPRGTIRVTGLDVRHTTDPAHLALHARNRTAGRPIGQIRMRLSYHGVTGEWMRW